MIAMQYRFRLPTSFDTGIIERRIRDSGHLLDNFPGLLLKAWCYSPGNDILTGSEPLYAPVYLWQDSPGMTKFLQSAGFQKLTSDFGWPRIDYWPVLDYQPGRSLRQSAFARREIIPIAPYSDLTRITDGLTQSPEITRIVAWDIQHWRRFCFELSARPFDELPDSERYRVGHLSLPAV